MTIRYRTLIASIYAAMFLVALCAVFAYRTPDERPTVVHHIQKSNPLLARPNMVDRLDFFDTPEAFDRATMQHVAISTTQPASVILSDQRSKSFPRSGTWTSEIVETEFPFTELIPSWNATVPRDTGVFFQVKTRDASDGEWSPWLYIGQWGRTPATDPADRVVEFDHGVVNVDNLSLDSPATAYQIRATLLSFDMN